MTSSGSFANTVLWILRCELKSCGIAWFVCTTMQLMLLVATVWFCLSVNQSNRHIILDRVDWLHHLATRIVGYHLADCERDVVGYTCTLRRCGWTFRLGLLHVEKTILAAANVFLPYVGLNRRYAMYFHWNTCEMANYSWSICVYTCGRACLCDVGLIPQYFRFRGSKNGRQERVGPLPTLPDGKFKRRLFFCITAFHNLPTFRSILPTA